jgi:hypothetical protein
MDDELEKLEYTVGKVRISTENRIFIDDIDDYVRAVKVLQPGLIMVTSSDRTPTPTMFEFVHQGFSYRTYTKGYTRLDDFLDGISQNIQDGSKYYDMKKGGFADQEQLRQAKHLGYQSQQEFERSKSLGFSGCMRVYNETYKKSKESNPVIDVQRFPTGAKEGHIFRFAVEHGFADFDEFINAMIGGFVEAADCREATNSGFDNYNDYSNAKSLGISTRDEYDCYLDLEKTRAVYGLGSHHEAFILHTMAEMEDSERIELDELWSMALVPGKYLKALSSESPSWYTRKIQNRSAFKDFLRSREYLGELGTLFVDESAFVRILKKSPTTTTVIVDGSNVAWGEGSRDEGAAPQVKYLELVLAALQDEGFDKIITIVDASLKHEIDEPEHFKRLGEEFQIIETPGGTSADEFILKEMVRENARVITNDKFEEWKQQDLWLKKNTDRFRVPFEFLDDKVVFLQ